MTVVSAFSMMFRTAAKNPGWAVGAFLFTALSKGGLRFAVLYVAIILVAGIWGGSSMAEAGFAQGTWGWAAFNIGFLVFMVILFLAMVTPNVLLHFGNVQADTHGSARFATDKEVAPLTRSGTGLLIGRDPKSKSLMRYDGPAHLLTMAPTRTGKGVGTIIPNLLTADRSVICIDPKGENAKIAGRARQNFGPVHVLDPFGITGKPSAAFNPLDTLDVDGLDVAEDASTLADALSSTSLACRVRPIGTKRPRR